MYRGRPVVCELVTARRYGLAIPQGRSVVFCGLIDQRKMDRLGTQGLHSLPQDNPSKRTLIKLADYDNVGNRHADNAEARERHGSGKAQERADI